MANQALDSERAYAFFIRSDVEDVDPNVVHLLISELTTSQYFNVSLLTVLIYHARPYHDFSFLILADRKHESSNDRGQREEIFLAIPGQLAEGYSICLVGNPPRILVIISWTSPLIYGTILLCLALFKAVGYWRMSSGVEGRLLVKVLIKDQILYYSFLMKMVDIRLVTVNPFIAELLGAAGSPTLLCVLGSQLLINLKEAATQATIGEYALATMSMYDHSSGAILSPAPRALSYPTHHPMFDITLDGPTLCAFIFPSTVHDTISNGSSDPPLPSQPSLSAFHFTFAFRAGTLNQLVQHSGSQPACTTHTRCTPSPHSLNLQNLLDLAIQLAGTERRPRRGDEDYFRNEAEAASGAGIGTSRCCPATSARLAKGIDVCPVNVAPQSLGIVSWSAPLIYGTTLLCLAVFKAAEYWKMSSGFKGFHLIRVLVEDQILYYGFAVATPTLLCVLGSHLLINLKEAGERGVNEGTNYRSKTVSDIEFAEGVPAAADSNGEGTSSV
ncbi:uncharacterized protein FOMMEDRAFT_159258 [Fomitiporia mediterranea MF3/22]|uniref:uncharacterized protein n=1 Tax=Fomitiporia mediterranea (strain MF3/22) TaxID=694068 RepID=UPI0004408F78|nr:uncharacterized protein FOMMEDRAFT_159258 [Fomitiporia mediterranea MF3/22]EJD00526.1 hypothetical protein FOMMEDRAFT_159258 [Fomitiporia mediterranea MF3/22]